MKYPARKRRSQRPVPENDEGAARLQLREAEYPASPHEEWPWRRTTDGFSGLAVVRHGLKPERGRLH
jgi:hypothetical protein